MLKEKDIEKIFELVFDCDETRAVEKINEIFDQSLQSFYEEIKPERKEIEFATGKSRAFADGWNKNSDQLEENKRKWLSN